MKLEKGDLFVVFYQCWDDSEIVHVGADFNEALEIMIQRNKNEGERNHTFQLWRKGGVVFDTENPKEVLSHLSPGIEVN